MVDGTSVLILVLGLPQAFRLDGETSVPGDNEGKASENIGSFSLVLVARNDNGDSAGSEELSIVGQVIDVGDNGVVDENAIDDSDKGDVGDDVPGFLLSRGREPFVLILQIIKNY